MSSLTQKEEDIKLLIVSGCHFGGKNITKQINQTTKKFIEPRLLIVTDPRTDYNAILESSYVNVPVIAI